MDTPENNVPNLDAEEPDALMSFWFKHHHGRAAKALFPAGGRGTRKATFNLAAYAANIATAKRMRLAGEIERALVYERIADRIYNQLPDWARW